MYLYYQQSTAKDPETGFGESWKAIKETSDTRDALAKKRVEMVSMLAISTTDDDADYEQLKYRGDLYFDIDNPDLEVSIESTKRLVDKLKAVGVQNITVYLSGKKGFHVTVPSKAFFAGAGAGIKWLPYIYGHMAVNHFAVEGLDLAVYSGGKGRLWRQPNVKRRDNGQYKVPVRLEELAVLNLESYIELASEPNFELEDALSKTEPTFSVELSSIFEESAMIVRKEQESKEVYRFESTPELEMLSEVPGCIRKLANGEDVKEGTNFNRAAMNLAGYLKSSNRVGSDVEDELVSAMSCHNNYDSATYTNDRARRTHIKSAIRRATRDKSMGCNPAYILSTVEKCGKCVICDGTLSKDKDKPEAGKKKTHIEEDGLRHNVFEIGLAYYKEYGPKTVKPLTTFIIEPISADIFFNKEHNCFRREALKCLIKYSSGPEAPVKTTTVTIEEDAWDSPALFKKQFKGIDNVAITCSEDDLADLRHYIMSKYNDIDNSIRTATIGLAIKEIPCDGRIRKVLVYTEPGYTASGNNVRVPVHYENDERSKLVGTPCIHKAPDLSPDNHNDVRVVKEIFNVNEPWACSTMIGWFAATALKPHIMSLNSEFPLLGVTGRPGTGKTTLTSLVADLAGCFYQQGDEPPVATSTQAFIERYIASSTSTPRIIDEMNAPAFRANFKLLETVKGAWNGLEIGKGTIGGSSSKANIATRSVTMTGSVAYISEQPQQDDALRQRSIEIILDMKCHPTRLDGSQIPFEELDDKTRQISESFQYVAEHENRERLRGAAKGLIHQSLSTSKGWVKERLASYAEVLRGARCHGRQKYGWRVVLTGLDLYELALKEQYNIDVSEEVANSKSIIIGRLLDKEITDNGSDNCNTEVLEFVSNMVERQTINEILDEPNRNTIPRGFGYTKTDSELYLNIGAYWTCISSDARASGMRLKYSDGNQFVSALRTEEYFVSMSGGQVKLDLVKLATAGIDVNKFYTEEEYEDKADGHSGTF